MELTLRTRVLTSIAKADSAAALAHAQTSLRLAHEHGLDLFIAVSHMLIGTVHMLDGRLAESESEFDTAIELAGADMPQVTIGALVASAAGLLRVDPARSIARAQEALRIEAQAEIMPWFRAIAARIIATIWASDNRAEDAVLVLTAMDGLEERLGFDGIWWAARIRTEAWELVSRTLTTERVAERVLRGRSLTMNEVRELLG